MISAPSGKIITRFCTARGVNPLRLIGRIRSAAAPRVEDDCEIACADETVVVEVRDC